VEKKLAEMAAMIPCKKQILASERAWQAATIVDRPAGRFAELLQLGNWCGGIKHSQNELRLLTVAYLGPGLSAFKRGVGYTCPTAGIRKFSHEG
jgi:hypothetical protein